MTNALLVVGSSDSAWAKSLGSALQSLGLVDYSTAAEVMVRISGRSYQMLIVDAEAMDSFGSFVDQIHRAAPNLPIVVVSASPTWQHAREAFLAGAADYIRKSPNQEPLAKTVGELVRRSLE
jgi:DNA-binding NtrC family response regulator